MAYEMVMPYHLHMPSYFLETFTEYPYSRQIALAIFYIDLRNVCSPLLIWTSCAKITLKHIRCRLADLSFIRPIMAYFSLGLE